MGKSIRWIGTELGIVFFLLFGLTAHLHGQQQNIQGTVIDASTSETLPGVNVVVKGTTTGTSTDAEGTYELSVSSLSDTLVFSFVGYQMQEVPINGRTEIDVALQPQAIAGEEMVVIGYGTATQQEVTGSISTVEAEDISKVTTTPNTANILSGKLPGIRIRSSNSEPGNYGSTSFDIRGFGEPLVVIDGVPSTILDFNRLNPQDIENISVLKDASAAVYGVQAANGVVLVTTKKGEDGKIEISYSGQAGVSTPTIYPEPLNVYQYATLRNEADINSGNEPTYTQEQLQQYKDGTLPGTDWYELLTREYAPQMQHNVSVSGGTDKITYYFSIGAVNDNGFYKNESLDNTKWNLRSNISAHVTDDLEVQLLLSGVQDERNRPTLGTGRVLGQELLLPPTMPVYANNNPQYLQATGIGPTNPVAATNSSLSGYILNINRKLSGKVSLNYTVPFITGLEAEALYSYNPRYNFVKEWGKEYALYNYDNATDIYLPNYRQSPTTLSEETEQGYTSDLQLSLNYERKFAGAHNIEALFLFEQYQESSHNFNSSSQFTLDAIDQFYAANANNPQVSSSLFIPSNRAGFIGRLKYNYRSKYFVEGTFRYDGSSKFAEGHRWGFFPGVSGSWRLSEEPFIQDNIPVISDLKLRASWGRLGDDAASNFQFLSGYNYPGGGYVFDTFVSGFEPRGLSNYNLSWFTAKTLDVGLEGSLWNDKLTFMIDVFRRNRSGLLATRNLELPGSLGASLPQENLNSDQTIGFEAKIGHADQIGNFSYNVSGNVSFSRTKRKHVERAPSPNAYNNWRNNNSDRWNDIIWGYNVVGQFTSQEDIDNWAIQDGQGNQLHVPGDFKYEDYNDDGVIDEKDMHPIGRGSTGLPLVNYGMSVDMTWKNFDLNILLQGGAGLYVNQNSTIFGQALPFKRNGLLDDFMDRWHREDIFDPNSPWVPGKYPSTKYGSLGGAATINYLPSTFWWHKDPYLRIKSLELGYNLPISVIQGVAKQVRIFVNGYNLYTWSKVSYIDPERPNNPGYPVMKSFNIGLNLTF